MQLILKELSFSNSEYSCRLDANVGLLLILIVIRERMSTTFSRCRRTR